MKQELIIKKEYKGEELILDEQIGRRVITPTKNKEFFIISLVITLVEISKNSSKNDITIAKIKAIANKIIAQYNRTNLCASVECINQKINNTGKKLANLGVSANFVTITGFVLGMIAVNFLALENYFWALVFILLNRLGDALDGAIAKVKDSLSVAIALPTHPKGDGHLFSIGDSGGKLQVL